ncbi:MAG: methyltransferase domain-containing protein [Desulfobacteraceae bacterium]|nr:MAG: methyltransferase domain-containing protein [Desulfobacteraceae bacterium]
MKLRYAPSFVCTKCEESLFVNTKLSEGKEIKEGEMNCLNCGQVFPIRDGIPIFISKLDDIKKHTAKSFGYKWKKFDKINEYYKKNFLDELEPLDYRNFFRGKSILDAGTGIGIPCYCIAENGAKEVFAADISDSVRAAYNNNSRFDNVTIAQGDIYALPFKKNSFDVVVCVAVLQHLPDPQKAFDILLNFVKPGGTLIIWVYAKEGNFWVRYFVEPFRKLISRKLPLNAVLTASYVFTGIFSIVSKCIYKPLNDHNLKCLPLHDYIMYRTNFDYATNVQMIFDQLLAPLSDFFSKKEIEALFNRPDVMNVVIRHHNRNSWTAIGDKVSAH